MDGRIRFEYATCGRGNFLNPERKSCGFKNIRIRVEGEEKPYVSPYVCTMGEIFQRNGPK